MFISIHFIMIVLCYTPPIEPASIVLSLPLKVPALPSQTVYLTCGAIGTPAPNISWITTGARNLSTQSDGVTINQTNMTINNTQFTVSVLELCAVNVSDTGDYQCIAENGVPGCTIASNLSSSALVVTSVDTGKLASNRSG